MSQTIRDRNNSRRVWTHENNSGETVRRLGTIIQSIFCAQSGASIRLNFWKQFGESRYPGALSRLLENFCPAFSPDPTDSLWVSGSEDAFTVELPMEASCASEKNGHFSSPYSYRRLCQFAIIRTNEPTSGLVNTVSCGSRKHKEEWTNQNAWKRPFFADWVILPLLPATPATLVHPVRTNPDIFGTAYFFTWIGPLTTHSQWFRSIIRIYAPTKCAVLNIFADACGRGLGSSLKATDVERYHDAESSEKKMEISDFDFSFRS